MFLRFDTPSLSNTIFESHAIWAGKYPEKSNSQTEVLPSQKLCIDVSQLMPYLVRERSGTFSQGRNLEKKCCETPKNSGLAAIKDPFEVKTV